MSKESINLERTAIHEYLRCSYPCLAVSTHEEKRLTNDIFELRKKLYVSKGGLKIFTISASKKLMQLQDNGEVVQVQDKMDFATAFGWVAAKRQQVLLVFDCQSVLANPGMYRALKDQFSTLKEAGSAVILVAPHWELPPELQHDVPVLEFQLPTRQELKTALNFVIENTPDQIDKPDAELQTKILEAASGLTLQEAEDAISLSVAKALRFEPRVVMAEKTRLIKASGLLELAAPPAVAIGGYSEFKRWVAEEVIPNRGDELLQARAALAVGIPGTGKSLGAKTMGALLGWPVLKFSMAKLKGGRVGQSERQINDALKLADAVAPCVLWCDEVEKAVSGYQSSGQTDGGTTSGMLGIWLEWMQEHTSPVLVCATANDYSKLPTEFTRRFDEQFFYDLPTADERMEIAEIQVARYSGSKDTAYVSGMAITAAELTDGFTGAEIEKLVLKAARRTRRAITEESIKQMYPEVRPISKVRSNEIDDMRKWAETTLRFANTPSGQPKQPKGRRISA